MSAPFHQLPAALVERYCMDGEGPGDRFTTPSHAERFFLTLSEEELSAWLADTE